MIGLAKACNGGGALANYVLDEKKGYELDRNLLCGSTPKELVEEMKIIQDLNQKAINKTFSMVLSPDIKDGKNLSDIELKAITKDYLSKLGIDPEKQQYVAFVHTEKEHKHIHIIANRIKPNGKLISDHHIGKRGQWAAHEIAKQRELVSAKEKMFENIKNIDKGKNDLSGIKSEIFRKHQSVMRDRPKTFSDYTDAMYKLGLEIKPTINKQGQIQGFRLIDKQTNSNFKLSEINRSMSAGNLIKNGLKNDLKYSLDSTLKKTEVKKISKRFVSRNIGVTEKKGIISTKGSVINPILRGMGKQKMSKEQYKEALKYEKLFEEVINPTSIHLEMSFIEITRQAEISKITNSIKKIEKDNQIEKSEKENHKKQNNLEI